MTEDDTEHVRVLTMKEINQMFVDNAPLNLNKVSLLIAMYSTLVTSLEALEEGFSPALDVCRKRLERLNNLREEFK